MTDIVNQIERVSDRDGFLRVVRLLSEESRSKKQPANMRIDEYLESVASWGGDSSTNPRNDIGWESVDYRLILRMLYMGSIYE